MTDPSSRPSSRPASGDTPYGTFLGLGSALAAEACALAGSTDFSWVHELRRRGITHKDSAA